MIHPDSNSMKPGEIYEIHFVSIFDSECNNKVIYTLTKSPFSLPGSNEINHAGHVMNHEELMIVDVISTEASSAYQVMILNRDEPVIGWIAFTHHEKPRIWNRKTCY